MGDVYAAEGMARRAHGQSGRVDGNVPTKNGGETSKSGNETRTNTKSTEPSKILSLNAQGLIKTDTKWKVEMIKEYVHENNIILMNFTETWLKKEIQDEPITAQKITNETEKKDKEEISITKIIGKKIERTKQ